MEGFFCHEATKTSYKRRFLSHLLPHVQGFIMSHLQLGFSITQIMEKYKKCFIEMCEKREEFTHNLFIFKQDIHDVIDCFAIETYKRDNNDVKFVSI